jgi:hypothetical protein
VRRTVLAVVGGGLLLYAVLLVGGGATVTYAGETMTCDGPIVRAEAEAGSPDGAHRPARVTTPEDRIVTGLARECERTDGQRLRLATLAGLLALAAGALRSTLREHQPKDSDMPQPFDIRSSAT